MHERTLADRDRIFGPDHPDTLCSRNNLALSYLAAEAMYYRAAEAIPLPSASSPTMREASGPPAPSPGPPAQITRVNPIA